MKSDKLLTVQDDCRQLGKLDKTTSLLLRVTMLGTARENSNQQRIGRLKTSSRHRHMYTEYTQLIKQYTCKLIILKRVRLYAIHTNVRRSSAV